MRKIITTILLLFVFLQSGTIMAQDFLKGNDLSTLKVDYLSDADIAKIKSQILIKKTTIEQIEPLALAKGMSAIEFAKLKQRLGNEVVIKKDVKKEDDVDKNDDKKLGRKQEKIVNNKIKDSINSLIFGSQLFDNPELNFEPNLNLATPVNYVLGPGD